MRIAANDSGFELPIGLPDLEAGVVFRRVRRQTKMPQRLFHAIVPDADLHDPARVLRRRHLAAEFLAEAHRPLNLLYGRRALPVRPPDIVLVADANVLSENNRHRGQRDQSPHAGPERCDGTLRRASKKLHPMEWVAAERAAAIARDRHVERSHIDAGADQPLDDLQLMDVGGNEIGLNAMLTEPLEVFEVEGWSGVDDHAGPSRLHLGIIKMSSLDVFLAQHRDDVPLRGAGC